MKMPKDKIKMRMKIPCCRNEGKKCNEPYCKFVYYSRLAELALQEWKNKCNG